MHPNDVDGMENSADPDFMSSQVVICTVCTDLSVQRLEIVMQSTIIQGIKGNYYLNSNMI